MNTHRKKTGLYTQLLRTLVLSASFFCLLGTVRSEQEVKLFDHEVVWLEESGDTVRVKWPSSSRLFWRPLSEGLRLELETLVEIPDIGDLLFSNPDDFPKTSLTKQSDSKVLLRSVAQRRVQSYTLIRNQLESGLRQRAGLTIEIKSPEPLVVVHRSCKFKNSKFEYINQDETPPLYIGIECTEKKPQIQLPENYTVDKETENLYKIFVTKKSREFIGELTLEPTEEPAQPDVVKTTAPDISSFKIGAGLNLLLLDTGWNGKSAGGELPLQLSWLQKKSGMSQFTADVEAPSLHIRSEVSSFTKGFWGARTGVGVFSLLHNEREPIDIVAGAEVSFVNLSQNESLLLGGPWIAFLWSPQSTQEIYSNFELRPILYLGHLKGGGLDMRLRSPSFRRILLLEFQAKGVFLTERHQFINLGSGIHYIF